jgi:uncharacterized protein (DUF736 family)
LKEDNMIIGTFRYIAEDDVYVGRIGTPAGRMSVTFNPQKSGADYRIAIHDADAELGAAWKRTSCERKPYLSVKLDSPFLPQPVNCALIERADDYVLVWSRTRHEDDPPAS